MDILKNTQFLKLWGNQILLQVAFNICNFTALLVVNNLTGSRFSLALLYACLTLPAFAVGTFAGAIVDLSSRKKLMLITDALLSVLFILYAVFAHQYPIILLIAFLSASVAQFFTPAEAATIPLIVKNFHLEKANSLFLFTALGSVLVGYALAGPLIELFGGLEKGGAQAAFVGAGIVTAIGFFLRLSLKTIEHERPQTPDGRLIKKTLHLTSEVFSFARAKERIYLPILLLTLMEFNIGMLSILFIDFVKKYLGLATTSISYFLVLPLILGLIIGVSILGQVQKFIPRGRSIFLSLILFSALLTFLGVLALHPSPLLKILTLLSALLIGFCIVFVAVHPRTILQENTPTPMLGRVFSLVTIASSAIAPIPVLLVSLVTEKVETPVVFISLGILFMGFTVFLNPKLERLS